MALSLGGTATDPWSTILDQDWVSDSQQSIEFSHTDSVVRGRMFLGDLSLRVGGAIRRGDGFAVAFVTGFRYERLAYEAYGVEGWQFDGRRRIPVSVPADSFHGGDYTSHRFLPRAGIQFRFERGPFQLECDLSPLLAIVKDTDDHVYRRKVAEATSVGLGVLLHLSPRLRLTPARARTAVSLVVDAEVRYLNTAGTLHQHYYGDDPSIPGDQTGIVIPDSTTYGDSSTSWLFTAGVVTGF